MKIIFLLLVVQMCINKTMSQLGSVQHALRYEVFKCQIPFSYHDISYAIPTQNLTNLESHFNHVNKHIHHLGSHSIGGKNIMQVLGYLVHCWRILIHKCSSDHQDKQLNENLQEQLMCGVIDTGMRLKNTVWYINTYLTFDLQLNFHNFYLPYSKFCLMVHLTIIIRFYSHYLIYCGKRAPWKLAFMRSSIVLRLFNTNIFDEYFFVLTYEAIDQTLTEIQIMQAKLVYFMLGDRRTIAITHSPYHNDGQYMRQDIVLFYFISHVLHSVCINFTPDSRSVLYDGPGEMSHEHKFTEDQFGKNVSYCFSKFIGTALLPSSNTSESFTWNTKFNIDNQGLCRHNYSMNGHHTLSAQDTGFGVHCIWHIKGAPEEIQLDHVAFLEHNMLTFFSKNTVRDKLVSSSCEYGGLYIFYTSTRHKFNFHEDRLLSGNPLTYLSLCNTINNKPSFRLFHAFNITATFLVFTTFEKYSTGSVEISLGKFTCKGYHYESYWCEPFGNLQWFKNNQRREWWSSSDNGMPSCKAIWIISNVEDKHVGKSCRIFLSFQSLTNIFMTGPQKVVVNNWITPLTPYIENISRKDYYNFHLNVTGLKGFPADMPKKQQLIVVPRDQIVHTYVPFLVGMDIFTNNAYGNLYALSIKSSSFRVWFASTHNHLMT